MKISSIYIARHGESECNINFNSFEKTDHSALTEKGVDQSLSLKEWFLKNNVNIKRIYTSEMKRCIDTASLLEMDVPIIKSKLLNERSIGDLNRIILGGIPVPLIDQFKISEIDYLFWAGTNGESQYETIQRVISFLLNDVFNPENCLFIAHGYVIEALRLLLYNNQNINEYFRYISTEGNHIRNCQIFEIKIDQDSFRYISEKSFYLLNNTWTEFINYKIL